jgi:hypothetical protein
MRKYWPTLRDLLSTVIVSLLAPTISSGTAYLLKRSVLETTAIGAVTFISMAAFFLRKRIYTWWSMKTKRENHLRPAVELPTESKSRNEPQSNIPEGIFKKSGDNQVARQHVPLFEPIVVQIIGTNGVPKVSEAVDFFSDTTSGYVQPKQVKTDHQGLASWSSASHVVGEQKIVAAVNGYAPVQFSITVTPQGEEFDGLHLITVAEPFDRRRIMRLIISNGTIPVDNSRTAGAIAGGTVEKNGNVALNEYRSIQCRAVYEGHLKIDARGRCIGSGIVTDKSMGRREGPDYTWTSERQ